MNIIRVDSNKVDSKTDNNIIEIFEDTTIIYNNSSVSFNFIINSDCKVFEYINNSNINNTYTLNGDLVFDRFSLNSSLNTSINLDKEGCILDYFYSTINIDDNKYVIDINHNKKNTKSNVLNHGINYMSNVLDFLINSRVLNTSSGVDTNQNSKIILLGDNNSSIKPNLLIDNDDIVANHASYIGYFKDEDLFYLSSRGICNNDAYKLLAKAFLMGNRDINYLNRKIILENINEYWR